MARTKLFQSNCSQAVRLPKDVAFGDVIKEVTILIAGHARSRGLIVVTGNLGEFERVDGLRCEDW